MSFRFFLISLKSSQNNLIFSPFDGGSGEPKSKKMRIGATRILQSNITAPVISSATNCLLVAAKGNRVRDYLYMTHCKCICVRENRPNFNLEPTKGKLLS